MEGPLFITLLLITGKSPFMQFSVRETAQSVSCAEAHCDASRETTNYRSKHFQPKLEVSDRTVIHCAFDCRYISFRSSSRREQQ
jgi:hypothetical protein